MELDWCSRKPIVVGTIYDKNKVPRKVRCPKCGRRMTTQLGTNSFGEQIYEVQIGAHKIRKTKRRKK